MCSAAYHPAQEREERAPSVAPEPQASSLPWPNMWTRTGSISAMAITTGRGRATCPARGRGAGSKRMVPSRYKQLLSGGRFPGASWEQLAAAFDIFRESPQEDRRFPPFHPRASLHFLSRVVGNQMDLPPVGMRRHHSGEEPFTHEIFPGIAGVSDCTERFPASRLRSKKDLGPGLGTAADPLEAAASTPGRRDSRPAPGRRSRAPAPPRAACRSAICLGMRSSVPVRGACGVLPACSHPLHR